MISLDPFPEDSPHSSAASSVGDESLFTPPGLPKNFLQPKKGRPIMSKCLMIAGLVLASLIPLHMISGLSHERQGHKEEAVKSVVQAWGGRQDIVGPILSIPYKGTTTEYVNGQMETLEGIQTIYLLPRHFQAKAKLAPEIRYRGIYQTVVYNNDLKAEGDFDLRALTRLKIPVDKVQWNEAKVIVGFQNPPVVNSKNFQWQNKPVEFLPEEGGLLLAHGLAAPVSLSKDGRSMTFKLSLSMKGRESLTMIPLGVSNDIDIDSDWQSPSFIGDSLPNERKVDNKGFTAHWQSPYPNSDHFSSVAERNKLMTSFIGVQLLQPVDGYRETERAIKYGVLFLVLTFATYFLFEVVGKQQLHPFQYLLIGMAISLFYLLLLAVSEVLPFGWAYLIASVGIISTITLYSKAILGRIHKQAQNLIAGLLAVLYSYLYILLQLEDFSLLFGALGLFAVLGLMMYVTRNIDWYGEQVA